VAARAQSAPTPPPKPAVPDDTTTSPVFTPSAAAPLPAVSVPPADDDGHGDPRRIQSAELAGALVDSIPKYSPPKAAPPPKPEDQQTDLRDIDKPKNGIIRLPKYVVHAAPPPIFTNKDVLDQKGRDDLAMKQYIIDTKDMPSFAAALSKFLFQDNASQQYADAERASNISSLRSDASAAAIDGDAAESSFIRQQSNDTYLRRSDWAPIGSRITTSSSPADAGGGNGQ
jgi:hypothetical protein